MSTPTYVEIERDGDIAWVWLNRPEKLNALTLDTLHQLTDVARTLRADKELRGVVLAGRGDSFCAGLDFATVMKTPQRMVADLIVNPVTGVNAFQSACSAWRDLPVPVVAAVRGNCLGGGLQIALAADFRVVSPSAQLAVLESRWGLIPDMTGVRTLAEVVGIDTAKLLTMTGRLVDGESAVACGLATQTADDPESVARDLIHEIATRSPDATAAAKRLFRDTWTSSERRTYHRERVEQFALLFGRNATIARNRAMKKNDESYLPRGGTVLSKIVRRLPLI